MSTPALRTSLIAVASIACLTAAANAAHPASHHGHYCRPELPQFDMHSYNNGYGEVIVRVRHGGLACQLGLEEGDVIERLNHRRLRYPGAWEDALARAMADGGHIVLAVRDVHSGRLVSRHIDLDPYGAVVGQPIGPITPKTVIVSPRVLPRFAPHAVGYGSHVEAPVTPRSRHESRPRFTLKLGL